MCMFVHVQVVCSPKPSIKQFGHYVGLLLWVSEGDLVQNMHGSECLHTLQTLRKDRKANRDTDGKELYREKNTASRKETWTG